MPIMYFESAKTNSALLSWFASWENLITLGLSGSKAELLTVSAMMINQLQARNNVSYYPLRTKTCFEIERITELQNKSYRAFLLDCCYSFSHNRCPQCPKWTNLLRAGKGKGRTDQGRGNSIGIPKNPYVFHFRYLSCLFRSRLEFVNPIPPPIKRMLVSLKDLALE